MSSTKDSQQELDHKKAFGTNVPSNSHTEAVNSMNIVDRNSIMNVTLLAISFYGFFFSNSWLLAFTWPLFLVLEDILFFVKGISLFSTEIGIKRGYQFGHIMVDDISGKGRDLGFNLYEGDLNKSYKQSQVDKFEYMTKHLGLKKGMKLLDCGCGYGDWLNYAKNVVGVEAVGVNITPEQAAFARNQYNLEIYTTNWKDILTDKTLQEKLYGRFDVITFMDTVEHYVSGHDRNNPENIARTYSNLFLMANKCMNTKSSVQKVFISCLHQNDKFLKPWDWKAKFSAYFLTRYHSGFYPRGRDGLTKHSAKYFKVINQDDKTEDYRLTAVLDSTQFQAPKINFTARKIMYAVALFVMDPHHLHKWIDIYFDCWMNLYGDDVYSKEYNIEKRRKSSKVILWWITLQTKAKAPK